MCDYSLHTYPNRLAAMEKILSCTGSGLDRSGLASPADLIRGDLGEQDE